jgi:hypothetical protein
MITRSWLVFGSDGVLNKIVVVMLVMFTFFGTDAKGNSYPIPKEISERCSEKALYVKKDVSELDMSCVLEVIDKTGKLMSVLRYCPPVMAGAISEFDCTRIVKSIRTTLPLFNSIMASINYSGVVIDAETTIAFEKANLTR